MGSNQIQDILTELANSQNLTCEMAERAFHIVMSGGATPAQIAALLMGLRAKGETVDEIISAAKVMRHKAVSFDAGVDALDTCGTGGDGKRSFNISTAVAIVIASCEVKVIKHGNRAVTSASGSSDVLQHLKVCINAPLEVQKQAFEEIGFCYLMAPLYHPAMRYVTDVRKELGLRTIFNLLGPLANPARTKRQLIGVYDKKWLKPMAEVLKELGTQKAWLVCGDDGMDEITITTYSHIVQLDNGNITEFQLNPADYGIQLVSEQDLRGGLPEDNAKAMQKLLEGEKANFLSDGIVNNKAISAYRDIVLLNSAAGLLVAGKCFDLHEGIELAKESIDSGKAKYLLANYAEMTNR